MRVMVFGKANEQSENGAPPTAEAFAAMDRFTEELVKAGVLVAGAGLKPTAQSKRIVCEGSARTVVDGPFTEAREVVAGFSIWEVKDMGLNPLSAAFAYHASNVEVSRAIERE